MKKLDDFKRPDGGYDWSAYQQAEIADGERCTLCEKAIFALYPTGYPTQCRECKDISRPQELSHSKRLRCPKCTTSHEVDWEDNIRTEGDHGIYCSACDFQFSIQTHVSYTFISPPLLEKTQDTSEDDEED